MPGAVLLSRLERHIVNTITLSTANASASDTITVFTVTGRVLIKHLMAFCTTSLTESAGTTLEFGTGNNSAALIDQTSVTAIDVNEFWMDSSPELQTAVAVIDRYLSANAILAVGSGGDISAGVIEIAALWVPMSIGANLA